MATRSAKVLSREQTVFCGALVVLVACAAVIGWVQSSPDSSLRSFYSSLFGSVPPAVLFEEAPLTSIPSPDAYQPEYSPRFQFPSDMSRATPFAPPPETVIVEGGWWKEVVEVARTTVRPFGPTVQVVNGDRKQPGWFVPSSLDGSVPAAYMGVLGASGQRVGMRRVRNGRFVNVREGDKLTDLGCTVIRVEKESIHLMTRTGIYHILTKAGS